MERRLLHLARAELDEATEPLVKTRAPNLLVSATACSPAPPVCELDHPGLTEATHQLCDHLFGHLVRFPEPVDKGLCGLCTPDRGEEVDRRVAAVREWLRMQAHPGIVFVTTVTGERRAALAVGPQVWTVAQVWLQHGQDERTPAVVADALGLTVADVETALAYWADYRDEIDELIDRHHTSQDDALAAWEHRRALDAV